MTNEEAVKWLQFDLEMMKFDPNTGGEAYLDKDAQKVAEALDMAIEALQHGCDKVAKSCDDYISRQDAIDELEKLESVIENEEKAHLIRICIGTINDLPSAQQWIPCSERLPETSGRYLVTRGWLLQLCRKEN